VPIAGDLADVAWKANLRNMELLERHAVPGTPATRGDVWFVVGAVALMALVAVLAVAPLALLIYVFLDGY
jgi:uncharacterized protein DUF4112